HARLDAIADAPLRVAILRVPIGASTLPVARAVVHGSTDDGAAPGEKRGEWQHLSARRRERAPGRGSATSWERAARITARQRDRADHLPAERPGRTCRGEN